MSSILCNTTSIHGMLHSRFSLIRLKKNIDKYDLSLLDPLNRSQVLFVDLWPYFFANTPTDPESGRSMWDDIQQYERLTGQKAALKLRPRPDDLLSLCQSSPDNENRLTELLFRSTAELLFTLENEPAA
jgi:hypothetical protein